VVKKEKGKPRRHGEHKGTQRKEKIDV